MVDGPSRFEGRQFDSFVDDLASHMRAAGIGRGQVVAWQLPNCTASLLLYWACWRIGAVAAPVHRRLGAAEVSAALDQVMPAVVVAAEGLPAADLPGAMVLALPGSPSNLADLFERPATAEAAAPRGPELGHPQGSDIAGSDIAAVLFTSGSSGVPKAVLHTHRGLAYKARLMARVHGLRKGDPVLAPAPLAHVSGLLNGVLISAAVKGPCVLIDPWDPEEGLSLLEQERVAFVGAPPIFFSQMAGLASFSSERVSALRLISTGGASVSPAFVESTAEAFGCRVKRTYGSTEAPTVTTSGPDDPHERARDTDGHPVGLAEVEIHEPESGRLLGPGEVGELWIRGPELFAGYASAELTTGGHRPTGRLVQVGRSRIARRPRVAARDRSPVGHHHQGGREHLGVGGRSGARGTPIGAKRRGCSRPRPSGGRARRRDRRRDGPVRSRSMQSVVRRTRHHALQDPRARDRGRLHSDIGGGKARSRSAQGVGRTCRAGHASGLAPLLRCPRLRRPRRRYRQRPQDDR